MACRGGFTWVQDSGRVIALKMGACAVTYDWAQSLAVALGAPDFMRTSFLSGVQREVSICTRHRLLAEGIRDAPPKVNVEPAPGGEPFDV